MSPSASSTSREPERGTLGLASVGAGSGARRSRCDLQRPDRGFSWSADGSRGSRASAAARLSRRRPGTRNSRRSRCRRAFVPSARPVRGCRARAGSPRRPDPAASGGKSGPARLLECAARREVSPEVHWVLLHVFQDRAGVRPRLRGSAQLEYLSAVIGRRERVFPTSRRRGFQTVGTATRDDLAAAECSGHVVEPGSASEP